jgi:hypothetical protein
MSDLGSTIFWRPFGVLNLIHPLSGGLRYAPTTGYYLSALQAEVLLMLISVQ